MNSYISTPDMMRIAYSKGPTRDPLVLCADKMHDAFYRVRFALAHIGMLPKNRKMLIEDYSNRLAEFVNHASVPDPELLDAMDTIMAVLGGEDTHPSEMTIIEELDQVYGSLQWVLDHMQAERIIRQLHASEHDR